MIKIICVGKLKEKYFSDAIEEYVKRIRKFTNISIIEVDDSSVDEGIIALRKEKDAIMNKIGDKDFLITLEIDAKNVSSIEFSEKLNNIFNYNSNIIFVIGGSYGLHDDVKKRSNYKLSFSKMTFPHQLFRVMLLEQIYRAFKILNNEKYHK